MSDDDSPLERRLEIRMFGRLEVRVNGQEVKIKPGERRGNASSARWPISQPGVRSPDKWSCRVKKHWPTVLPTAALRFLTAGLERAGACRLFPFCCPLPAAAG